MKKKKSNNKAFTIFNFIPSIIKDKKDWNSFTPEQKKQFNSFMVFRLLSMNPNYIPLIDYISGLNIKENEKIYKILCDVIPKSNKTFFPFIKKKKLKKYNPEVVDIMVSYFQNSRYQIEEYLDLMEEKEIINICSSMGVEEEIINSIINFGK